MASDRKSSFKEKVVTREAVTFGEGLYLAFLEEITKTEETETEPKSEGYLVIWNLALNEEIRKIKLPQPCSLLLTENNILLCFDEFSHHFLYVIDPFKENAIVQSHEIYLSAATVFGDYFIYGNNLTGYDLLSFVRITDLLEKNFVVTNSTKIDTPEHMVDQLRGMKHIAASDRGFVVGFQYEIQFLEDKEKDKKENLDDKQKLICVRRQETNKKKLRAIFSANNPIAMYSIQEILIGKDGKPFNSSIPFGFQFSHVSDQMQLDVLDYKKDGLMSWKPSFPVEQGSGFLLVPHTDRLLVSYKEGSPNILFWNIDKQEEIRINLGMPIRALFVDPATGVLGILPVNGSPIAYDLNTGQLTDFKKAREYKEGVEKLAGEFIPSRNVIEGVLRGFLFGDIKRTTADKADQKSNLNSPKKKS